MRAIVHSEYRAADVLSVADIPTPRPAAGELLIRVRAAEVTKADTELRSFRFPVSWFWLPLRLAMGIRKPRKPVLGGYLAGVVEGLGEGVSGFAIGDELYGSTGMGLGAHGE